MTIANLRAKFHVILRWLPAVLWATAVFVSSHFAIPAQVAESMPSDKVLHFGVYAILAVLVCWASKASSLVSILLAALGCALFGFLDELHQSFIPGRSAELMDGLADALGAAMGCTVYLIVVRLKENYRRKKETQPSAEE